MNTEKDIQNLADEIKTIKGMLSVAERKLPIAGWIFYVISGLVMASTFVWYFVPFLRSWDVDNLILFYFLPTALIVFMAAALAIVTEQKGKKGLTIIGPLKDMLFARFVVFPAIWFPIWLLRYDQSLVSLILVGIAGIQGVMVFILPRSFRYIAIGTLIVGLTEFAIGLRGPEIALLNGILIGLAFLGAGLAYNWREPKVE